MSPAPRRVDVGKLQVELSHRGLPAVLCRRALGELARAKVFRAYLWIVAARLAVAVAEDDDRAFNAYIHNGYATFFAISVG